METVRSLAAVVRDHHPHRERARGSPAQRAQIVGDAFGQHRHHAIREIHRVAALQRLAIQRRARPHIEGDIGDRDGDDVAAFIVGIGVRLGMDRVVMVLGVGRIDGDQRQVAPVFAARERCRLAPLRLRATRPEEGLRNFVGVDRDQADRFFRASEPSRSFTLPEARPKPRVRTRSTLTRSPSSAPWLSALAMFSSRPACFLSTGMSRPPPSGRARKIPSRRVLALIDLDDASAIDAPSFSSGFSTCSSARSPTPAAVPGCGRRRTWMRIFGGAPLSSSSHSVGWRAIRRQLSVR